LEGEAKELEFQTILECLRSYQAEHGHLRIPKTFKAPESPPWPEEAYGLKLGARVYNLRFWQEFVVGYPERRNQLEELGFLWARLQNEYNLVVEALINYKMLNGHLMVPAHFIVPCTEDWPEHLWDLKLGVRVTMIRQRNDYVRSDSKRWIQLNQMGFIWNPEDKRFAEVILALQKFRELNGHLNIPTQFVIPMSNNWPSEVHGLALGEKVRKIREEKRFLRSKPQRTQQLEELGFVWTSKNDQKFQALVTALEAYKAYNGNVDDIPKSFIVPKSRPWPEVCWGLTLGEKVLSVKRQLLYVKNKPERIKRLKEIGLKLTSNPNKN